MLAPYSHEATYHGLVLLIDEADNAGASLQLGTFCKLLTERLQRHGCEKVSIFMAGLPTLRDVLMKSHASSVRVFQELPLQPLSDSEIGQVIDRCVASAKAQGAPLQIEEPARSLIVTLSEGYPHFVQQFGYSACEYDKDDVIDHADAIAGAFGDVRVGFRGALEEIGDRYYRDAFYRKIQNQSYRQVLRIMADKSNDWVTKSEIRAKFKGKTSTLDNALVALRTKHIILDREGARGEYRLQHKGFALWINLFGREHGGSLATNQEPSPENDGSSSTG